MCVISYFEEANDNSVKPHKVIADASECQNERICPLEPTASAATTAPTEPTEAQTTASAEPTESAQATTT